MPMHKKMQPKEDPTRRGFTLIELLVVIAIIAILAALLLPGLARAKAQAQGVKCMNNEKQLALAWLMYADDFVQRLVPNVGDQRTLANSLIPYYASVPAVPPYELASPNTGTFNLYNWCTGDVNGSASTGLPGTYDETNGLLLTSCLLGPYIKSAEVFKCPADPGNLVNNPQLAGSRIRSISMQNYVNSYSGSVLTNVWTMFYKLTDMLPTPSKYYVFLDEKPTSIDDGLFELVMPDQPPIVYKTTSLPINNEPSQAHNGACGFSFGDGHAEIHKWTGTIFQSAAYTTGLPPLAYSTDPNDYNDQYWLDTSATYSSFVMPTTAN